MDILQPVDPNERYRRRRRLKQRRRRVRRAVAALVLVLLVGGFAFGAHTLSSRPGAGTTVAVKRAVAVEPAKTKPHFRDLPPEIRGVHVTMALASIPGRIDQYLALAGQGLNTIELDVKDENGDVGFPAAVPLARKVGSAKNYYDPEQAVAKIHAAGLYLIGRVVTFEDPVLSAGSPSLAIRRADGSRWLNSAGLGWTNPYDKRVWKYNVDIAEQAAKLGFDEIQFDYVRFPTDGDHSAPSRSAGAKPSDK